MSNRPLNGNSFPQNKKKRSNGSSDDKPPALSYDLQPGTFRQTNPMARRGGLRTPPPTRGPPISSSRDSIDPNANGSRGRRRSMSGPPGVSLDRQSTTGFDYTSESPNGYYGRPWDISEEERQADLAYAHEVFLKRPEWLQKWNPELPGGGFKVPLRGLAPKPPPEQQSARSQRRAKAYKTPNEIFK